VPDPNRSSPLAFPANNPLDVPPPLITKVPLVTFKVPLLLNLLFMVVCTPAVLFTVPAFSKSALDPPHAFPPPVHVTVPSFLMSLFKYFQFVPPIDKVAPDPIVVRPVPPRVPPLHDIDPVTEMSPLPSMVPPVKVNPVTVTLVVTVTVPELMVAVSDAPGSCEHDQLLPICQLPLPPFQVQVSAPATLGIAPSTSVTVRRTRKTGRFAARIGTSVTTRTPPAGDRQVQPIE
jgi:hypothetical protein